MSQRMKQKKGKVDPLKALRDARNNRSRAEQYTSETAEIYEPMDDSTHGWSEDDNFVEDDDNAGYTGNDEDEQSAYLSDYDESHSVPGKRKRNDKKKDSQRHKAIAVESKRTIQKLFEKNASNTEHRKHTVTVPKENEDLLFADLLAGIDEEVDDSPTIPYSSTESVIRRNAVERKTQPIQEKSRKLMRGQRISRVDENGNTREVSILEPVNHALSDESDVEIVEEKTTAPIVIKKEMEDDPVDIDMNYTTSSTDAMPQETPVKGEETPSDLQDWRLADASFINNVSEISRDDPQKYNIFEEDGSLRIWWFDVYERRDKGDIYLFGKVLDKSTQRYVSCSVAVRNILRDIYILPRTHQLDTQGKVTNVPVIMDNVFSEISDICTNYGITRWTDSICTRKYAFELPDIPAETKYLRIGYGFNQPALPMELKGKTFSHVFGINTNPLEHFLIERDIMGPCWLVIKNAKIVSTNESWCKTELSIDSPEHCTPLRDADGNAPQHIPPLSVMSLCLRTVRNTQKNSNEIVAASVFISTQVKIDQSTHIDQQDTLRFNVVRKLANKVYPAGFESLVLKEKDQNTLITVESTESSLLNFLIAKIHTNDPDVIVGHNFLGFDLDILLHRMKFLNTQHWHKLGRLKRTHWPRLQNGPGGTGESTYEEKMVMSGRLVCDTYMAAKDLIQSKSYRMTELAQSQLKIAREDIQFDQTEAFYESAPSLIHLLKHCSFDSYLAMALMFKLQILPLTLQLTNLAGNLWSRTLLGARAERNEYLLLHEFHRQNFVCPDKTFGKKTRTDMFDTSEYAQEGETKSQAKKGSSRRKPAYAGGLVLEPKKGFYDKYVLLLDFNSLYPSIIQEYNICFTTVERKEISELEVETVPEIPDSMLHQGVLPRMIKTLVDRRGQVKRLMKDPKLSKAEYMQYDIRQKALKLTANSMYGCLGFSHSRFYAKPLAMLITHKGREILQNTVDLAGDLDLNVIYGDTDSVMLYTNQSDIAKAKEIGVLFKQRVNERYRLLEIDIDGLFKHILLLKKKKYAAVLVQEQPDGKLVETIEIRGLDLVRRDWCDLSHDVSSSVLNSILSDKDREEVVDEIHTYLRATGEKIRSGEIPIAKFIINKQLTKNPEDYADAKSQPHVQVAIRMKQSGQSVRTGETVPYVICKLDSLPENSKAGPAERAYHPDEVARSNMQLDIEWYLNQQVFPPITRLCSDIDGTDPARIAEYLGLDKSKFNFRSGNGTEEDSEFGTLESQIGDQERFKNVEKLVLLCNKCEKEVILDSVFIQTSSNSMEWGLHCNYCLEDIHINNASNQLSVLIRRFIRKYYECWLVCDDSTCGNRTRMMSVYGRRCLNRGCLGLMHREFSDKALYTQLLYFSYFFDSKRIIHNAVSTKLEMPARSITVKHEADLKVLKEVVERYLRRSDYCYVNLEKLLADVKI